MKIRHQKLNGRLIPLMDTDLADFPKERWKDIPDFENYQISTHGRVKAKAKAILYNDGKIVHRQERILRLRLMRIDKTSKSLLVQMNLRKESQYYSFSVCRLVYKVFVADFDNLDHSLIIKRKDNDYLNCHYRNLKLELPTHQHEDLGKQSTIRASNKNELILNTNIANLPGEQWKFVPGFDEKYQLSNYGRVKSVERTVVYSNGRVINKKARIHKLTVIPLLKDRIKEFGIHATLMMNDKAYGFSVPRLVYYLFVSPFDLDDHSLAITKKDGNDFNCHHKNLQLKTGGEIKMETFAVKGVETVMRNIIKSVSQYNLNGTFLNFYGSIAEASQATNIPRTQISNAIYRRQLQDKKYYWRTGEPKHQIDVSEYTAKANRYLAAIKRPVHKFSLDGKLLDTYPSISSAQKAMGCKSENTIVRALRNSNYTAMGFRWRYADSQDSAVKKKIKRRPVNQYSMKGRFLKRYLSASEAGKSVGIVPSAISNAARLKHKMAKEFYWRYGKAVKQIDVSEFEEKRQQYFNSGKKAVQKLSLDNKPVETFDSLAAAADSLRIGSSALRRACNDPRVICKGFRWRLVASTRVFDN